MKHWEAYVKASYELVMETEQKQALTLDHELEAYIVHVIARNFERTDIGSEPVATQIMQAMMHRDHPMMRSLADECLLIDSYPIRRHKWPSDDYYRQMGVMAYTFVGNEVLAWNFKLASRILRELFNNEANNTHQLSS